MNVVLSLFQLLFWKSENIKKNKTMYDFLGALRIVVVKKDAKTVVTQRPKYYIKEM